MHSTRFTHATQATVLACIAIVTFVMYSVTPAHAADLNLVIDKSGQVINAETGKSISELHRGWREDVLFVSLSSRSLMSLEPASSNYTINLTSSNYDLDALNPRLYAVHGGTARILIDNSLRRAWLVNAPLGSSVTIVAQVPSGLIHPTFGWRIITVLGKIPDVIWLLFAVSVPLFFVLMFVIRKMILAWRARVGTAQLDPELLKASPAALTVLWRGFVSRRATAATVVDLARRGHVQILVRADALMIYRRESSDPLRDHETKLMDRWFGKNWDSKIHILAQENKRQLVNEQSTQVNMAIYDEINAYGWFSPSPLLSHWQAMTVSFILTVVSSIAFFIIFTIFPNAAALLWFLTGCLVGVGLLYALAPQYTQHTTSGYTAYSIMLAARVILTGHESIHVSQADSDTWQNWLPIAMVLGVPRQWLKRWMHHPFQQPAWFLTEDPIRTFDQFLTLLNPVLDIASESIRDKILPAYL